MVVKSVPGDVSVSGANSFCKYFLPEAAEDDNGHIFGACYPILEAGAATKVHGIGIRLSQPESVFVRRGGILAAA